MFNIKNTKYKILDSNISGKGVFANTYIKKGEIIEHALDFEGRTGDHIKWEPSDFGKYINHCENGNTKIIEVSTYDGSKQKSNVYLQAIKEINKNEEITCNYNNSPFYIENSKPWFKKC